MLNLYSSLLLTRMIERRPRDPSTRGHQYREARKLKDSTAFWSINTNNAYLGFSSITIQYSRTLIRTMHRHSNKVSRVLPILIRPAKILTWSSRSCLPFSIEIRHSGALIRAMHRHFNKASTILSILVQLAKTSTRSFWMQP